MSHMLINVGGDGPAGRVVTQQTQGWRFAAELRQPYVKMSLDKTLNSRVVQNKPQTPRLQLSFGPKPGIVGGLQKKGHLMLKPEPSQHMGVKIHCSNPEG